MKLVRLAEDPPMIVKVIIVAIGLVALSMIAVLLFGVHVTRPS
jgi:hypothetical protein